MRILYFSSNYTSHDWAFLSKLVDFVDEVYFLPLAQGTLWLENRALPDSVQILSFKNPLDRLDCPKLCMNLLLEFETILARIQPNLIHAGPIQTCGFMTALTDYRPFLAVSWGSDILVDAKRNQFFQWATQYTLKKSDYFLCDCQAVSDEVQDRYGYNTNNILQFPWGVDLDIFKPGEDTLHLREELGWQDCIILLSTRSWEEIYGIETLLEAFRDAWSQNSQLRLIMLGDGSLREYVTNFIRDQEMGDIIYTPGRIPHDVLPLYFRAADIYISCSKSDGSSVSLLEAMATALPVIVSDIPGNKEWIDEPQNGYLARSVNNQEFTEKILDCADSNKHCRNHIGLINRELIAQDADWNLNIKSLHNIYLKLYQFYSRI